MKTFQFHDTYNTSIFVDSYEFLRVEYDKNYRPTSNAGIKLEITYFYKNETNKIPRTLSLEYNSLQDLENSLEKFQKLCIDKKKLFTYFLSKLGKINGKS